MGYIYAIFFDNGLVKVGKSKNNVKSRLSFHKKIVSLLGASVLYSTNKDVFSFYSGAEKELISFCRSNFSQANHIGKEWFFAPNKYDRKMVVDKIMDLSDIAKIGMHGCLRPSDSIEYKLMGVPVSCNKDFSIAKPELIMSILQEKLESIKITGSHYKKVERLQGMSEFQMFGSLYLTSNSHEKCYDYISAITECIDSGYIEGLADIAGYIENELNGMFL